MNDPLGNIVNADSEGMCSVLSSPRSIARAEHAHADRTIRNCEFVAGSRPSSTTAPEFVAIESGEWPWIHRSGEPLSGRGTQRRRRAEVHGTRKEGPREGRSMMEDRAENLDWLSP